VNAATPAYRQAEEGSGEDFKYFSGLGFDKNFLKIYILYPTRKGGIHLLCHSGPPWDPPLTLSLSPPGRGEGEGRFPL